MPLTDVYGQNIQYSTLTDPPNIQTLGEGIVNGLTPQSVMRFPSASVRGATIQTPQAGMVTWLQDTGKLEVFDGTGWSTITAGTSAWTDVTLTASYSNGNNNNQGNFAYRLVNLFGELGLQFRGGVQVTYIGNAPATTRLNAIALPPSCRPPTNRRLTVLCPCSDQNSARIALKMDITDDGLLNLVGFQSDTKPPWVSFNGVSTSLFLS